MTTLDSDIYMPQLFSYLRQWRQALSMGKTCFAICTCNGSRSHSGAGLIFGKWIYAAFDQ